MNKAIIRMAREADEYADKRTPLFVTVPNEWQEIRDKRFADLVRADERKRIKAEPVQEPVQEPVAVVVARQYDDGTYAGNELNWAGRNCENDFPVGTKLYTAPPEFVPLTDDEVDRICASLGFAQLSPREVARAIEQALKEKNRGR